MVSEAGDIGHGHTSTFISISKISLGEYVRSDYIESIERTYSPVYASSTMSQGPDSLRIKCDRDGVLLQTIFSFHEGGPEIKIAKDGAISVVTGAGEKVNNICVHSSGKNTIIFGYSDFKPHTYQYVDDIESYLREHIFSGTYKDENGRIYRFTSDGNAYFPSNTFTYYVGFDHTFYKFDWFNDETNRKLYSFERSGDRLKIYETHGEPDGPGPIKADSVPVLDLIKQNE